MSTRRPFTSLALAVAVLLSAAVAVVLTDEPASSGSAGWINDCTYSHTLSDDPIVFRNQPGASHSHDFFGSNLTSATSTGPAMRADGTSCALAQDTSAYWIPSFYLNGVAVHPSAARFYYRDSNLDAGTVVQAFPRGFKMIAGNSHATSAAQNPYLGKELYFGCADNSTDKLLLPPTGCPDDTISVHVGFPSCWDNTHLDSADHQSHVVYPSGGVCPGSHPVALPRLIARFELVGVGTWTLASGATYTLHGDFWNTWDQIKLRQLTRTCLNQDRDCGVF